MTKTAPFRALTRTAIAAGFVLLGAASALAQALPTPPVRTAPNTQFRADPPPSPARPATTPANAPKPADLPPPSLDRINAYFNGLRGFQADFVQIAPDGRNYGGILYLLRPGRMRFEYHPPAQLEIVADGRSVAIRDRKLRTQDVYFIGQTPLKFLLAQRIDIAKDSTVKDLKRAGDDVQLFLEDKSTIGGTSKIRVVFDGQTYALKEWTVTDPQGFDTRVMLSNLNTNANPDRSLFVIEEQKIINPN
ncbi:MAG: outer-membrane lipoprotein carrier protein LolA [Beijerinckiaceae bacterium]|jgi:outer membrane lipoprotein-sorting protein|nr:outer-membrane lipoprotein carrier protein LolA [Beijerinckiaceae bacterium]